MPAVFFDDYLGSSDVTDKSPQSVIAMTLPARRKAFSSEFWEQSVIAEVYSLNAFFMALCILLLFMWYESRRNLILYIFAFVYGLSICNHNTMNLMAPVFMLFVVSIDRTPWQRWKVYQTSLK